MREIDTPSIPARKNQRIHPSIGDTFSLGVNSPSSDLVKNSAKGTVSSAVTVLASPRGFHDDGGELAVSVLPSTREVAHQKETCKIQRIARIWTAERDQALGPEQQYS